MSKRLLNLYQSAALIGISPKLLKYFTRRAVKHKDPRKLNPKKIAPELFFEESELREYDTWLRAPWPSKPKTRPHLPDAIRDEIKIEANLECALCCKSGEAGEAAHIEPLKQGKCNHPHNLIWLCANHHTKFDNGCFGPTGASNSIIRSLKESLQHFKKTSWQGQAEISQQIASILHMCNKFKEQLSSPTTETERKAIERAAQQLVDLLPDLAVQQSSKNVKQTLSQLSEDLDDERRKPIVNTRKQLEIASSYEDEYLEKSGLKRCPLCAGSHYQSSYDCPVCDGDGSISSSYYPDLSPYETVDCGLCEGSGQYNSADCPVCSGDGEIERRFDDVIDYKQYADVECPLCEGTARYEHEDCPACRGEGCLPKRVLDNIDLRDFESVKCPLCEGRGNHNQDTCRACRGDRYMQKRYADNVDLSEYQDKKCPVCKGSRSLFGEECPACSGEGYMPAGYADQLDLSLYTLVKCPACKGKGNRSGDECSACNGDRRMLKLYVDKYY